MLRLFVRELLEKDPNMPPGVSVRPLPSLVPNQSQARLLKRKQ